MSIRDHPPCTAMQAAIDLLEEDLDDVIDRLMSPGAEAADGKDSGRAESLAYALAVMTNIAHPDIEEVKDEAMLRWEARQQGDEDD